MSYVLEDVYPIFNIFEKLFDGSSRIYSVFPVQFVGLGLFRIQKDGKMHSCFPKIWSRLVGKSKIICVSGSMDTSTKSDPNS